MKYCLPRNSVTFLKKVSIYITESFTNEYFNEHFSVFQLIVLVLLPAIALFWFTLN